MSDEDKGKETDPRYKVRQQWAEQGLVNQDVKPLPEVELKRGRVEEIVFNAGGFVGTKIMRGEFFEPTTKKTTASLS